VSNPTLSQFLNFHYNIVGIYRNLELIESESQRKAATQHNLKIMTDAIRYLRTKQEKAQHLFIFPQGTISDINRNSVERINPGFSKIALVSGAPCVNIFIEYPSTHGKTRIIFSDPYTINDKNANHGEIWLKSMVAMQNTLKDVRPPVLSEKHANNNKLGDAYFTP